MTELRILVDPEDYKRLVAKKRGRTWLEVLKDGADLPPAILRDIDTSRRAGQG